jgi:hypothetical protein
MPSYLVSFDGPEDSAIDVWRSVCRHPETRAVILQQVDPEVPPPASGEGDGGEDAVPGTAGRPACGGGASPSPAPKPSCPCRKCGKNFASASGRYAHEKKCSVVHARVGGDHRCSVCNHPFSRLSDLNRHFGQAHKRQARPQAPPDSPVPWSEPVPSSSPEPDDPFASESGV